MRIVVVLSMGLGLASGHDARADDTQKIMLAAMVNVHAGLAPLCERREPGYKKKFDAALRLADEKLLSKEGINAAMRARAEEIPELASAQIVRKFDGWDDAKRKVSCEQGLRQLKDMADAGGERK